MKRSGCSEEHKAKGNFESGEVPTIAFLPFTLLQHTNSKRARTHAGRAARQGLERAAVRNENQRCRGL